MATRTRKAAAATSAAPADTTANGETERPKPVISLREAKRYVWRTVDRMEDRGILKFKVLDLNVLESEEIPTGIRVPLRDAAKKIAPYIVEWDLVAEDLTTGKEVPVPVPNASDPEATRIAGAGNEWELLFILDDYTVNRIIMWLKNPAFMKLQEKEAEAEALKAQEASPKGTGART